MAQRMVLVTCSRPFSPGIEQQDALAVGELDRGHVGLAGDLRNLMQIRAEFLPAPDVGKRLYLAGRDAPRRQLSAAFAAGLAEPGALRRRVRLRAHPDIMLTGLGVDRLHQFARLAGQRRMGGFGRGFGCGGGGHDVLSCDVQASGRRFSRRLPAGRRLIRGRPLLYRIAPGRSFAIGATACPDCVGLIWRPGIARWRG